MDSLSLSPSFEYLCYWYAVIRNICTLTVQRLTLDVRFWRLYSYSAETDFRRQILTSKVDPFAVRVHYIEDDLVHFFY